MSEPLPGMDVPVVDVFPRRIWVMWQVFGRLETKVCKGCRHLQRMKQTSVWYKCALSTDSGGPGSDWRMRWPACGRWEA